MIFQFEKILCGSGKRCRFSDSSSKVEYPIGALPAGAYLSLVVIKTHQNWVVQFASTDDPFIPIEEPRHIHAMLESDYHEHSDRGHFTNLWFPELVMVIKEKLV